jgi:SAM-dependent methyltransferase
MHFMDKATVAIYEEVATDWQKSRGQANDDLGRLCREQVGHGLVIDLGCGPGRYLGQIGAPAVGLDVSASMLDLARGQGHPLVRADLEALPFCDNAFAGAFARHSYLHLSKAQATGALAELRRVVRPGGRLVITLLEGTYEGHDLPGDDYPGRYYAFWTGPDLAAALRLAGFTDVTVAVVPRRKGGTDLVATAATINP